MNCLLKIDNFVLSDFLDLVHPEAVEEARNRIIGALQSYEMSKYFLIQQTILAGKEGSLTVWALYAYFSDFQNAAFELLV